ncbi:MAG: gliding motility-associated-like protein [Candidatus Azotimanducaceae bacterium]|jgi:gliding motility-associated-like protein
MRPQHPNNLSRKLNFLLLLVFFSSIPNVYASHIIGGELSYTYVGNNEYLISAIIYQDCHGNIDEDVVQIRGRAQDGSYTEVILTSVFDGFVETILISNPCFKAPGPACIRKEIFQQKYTFPNKVGGWQIYTLTCCRSGSVQNIDNPVGTESVYYGHIPENSLKNNSPYFLNDPPPVICMLDSFIYDHSMIEIDGDSVVYSLCDPKGGDDAGYYPYTNIVWMPGFSALDPITSNFPFTIDPETGLMIGFPNTLGNYIYSVCYEEFRDGKLIGRGNRDFMFTAKECAPTTPYEMEIEANYIEQCLPNYQFIFTIKNAERAEDNHNFEWQFPGGNPSSFSGKNPPAVTYDTLGAYQISVDIDGFKCVVILPFEINVGPPFTTNIEPVADVCIDSPSGDFILTGSFSTNAKFEWNFGDATPSIATTQFVSNVIFGAVGNHWVYVVVEDYGCSISDSILINVETFIIDFVATNTVQCLQAQEIQFFGFADGDSLNSGIFLWDFGDGNSSSLVNPTHTYANSGNYAVKLTVTPTNGEFCEATYSKTIEVKVPHNVNINSTDTLCWFDVSSFYATGNFSSKAIFSWDFGSATPAAASSKDVFNVTFPAIGDYMITLGVKDFGCMVYDTTFVHIDTLIVDFYANSLEHCVDQQVIQFYGIVDGQNIVPGTFYWDFGDGNSSTQPNPSHIYSQAGNYKVTMEVLLNQGELCEGKYTIAKPNYIVIHPLPTANFTLADSVGTVFNPNVSITNHSEHIGSEAIKVELNYYVNIPYDSTREYLYPKIPAEYEVSQIVFSHFGCTDTLIRLFTVLDKFQFYCPNSFTPNNDSQNDFYLQNGTGLSNPLKYELKIIDRWGKVIFKTKDLFKGWNGYLDNGMPAKVDVYYYKSNIVDFQGETHYFKGRISLIR